MVAPGADDERNTWSAMGGNLPEPRTTAFEASDGELADDDLELVVGGFSGFPPEVKEALPGAPSDGRFRPGRG